VAPNAAGPFITTFLVFASRRHKETAFDLVCTESERSRAGRSCMDEMRNFAWLAAVFNTFVQLDPVNLY